MILSLFLHHNSTVLQYIEQRKSFKLQHLRRNHVYTTESVNPGVDLFRSNVIRFIIDIDPDRCLHGVFG